MTCLREMMRDNARFIKFDYSCSKGTITRLHPPGGTPYRGLYGEAPPERGAFFKPTVYKRVRKIVILVYERVTKWAHGHCWN